MAKLAPIHIFDFNGTLISKDFAPACEKYFKEKLMTPLFEPAKGMVGIEEIFKVVCNPPKFTAARAAYYNIIEGEIRNKKIDVGLASDVLTKESVLVKLKETGVASMLLSRGTVSLTEAILDGVGLDPYFTLHDSTIPYGNNKVKETYLALIKSLRERGYETVAFYDDEPQFVVEIYRAGKELAGESAPPFKIFWINRDETPFEFLLSMVPEEDREDLGKHVLVQKDLLGTPI